MSYRVILFEMKTAISIPDVTFLKAEERAKKLGLNRSQFFTIAIASYLEELDKEPLNTLIDDAIGLCKETDDSSDVAVTASIAVLVQMDDEWVRPRGNLLG